MELFQEFFVRALLALVFAGIIAKLVSISFRDDGNKAAADEKVKVVGKQVELDNKRLRVKGTKSKKSVKFADDVVVKHVDYHYQFEAEEESKDFDVGIKRTTVVNDDQDHVCDKGSESNNRVFVELMEEVIVKEKGEIFTWIDQVDDQGVNDDDDVRGKLSESIRILVESMEGVNFEEKSKNGTADEDGKVILYSDNVGECVGDGEKVSQKIGLLNQEVVEGKSEDIKTDESFSVKEPNEVINGVDSLIVEKKMKHSEGMTVEYMMEKEDVSLDCDVVPESDGVAIGVKEEDIVARLGENQGGLSRGDEEKGKVTNEAVFLVDNDDDEWEEVERTQLEKRFGNAVNYVECGVQQGKDAQLVNLGSDVQMQLYGLHKIAVEGPCHEPQPMALNFSARAKWNAWQKLGSMSPEIAMEEYTELLTENVPGWIQHYSAEYGKQSYSESDDPGSQSSFQDVRPNITSERELEFNCVTKGEHPTAGTNSG